MRGLLVLGLIASLVLAGCVGGGATSQPPVPSQAPPEAEPPEFSEDTGAIQGVVTSDEGLPLADVVVGLVETGATTTTAQSGQYTLSNLAPGDYTLSVALLGYQTVAKKISIEAGKVSQANFQLASIAIDEPYHVSLQQFGNIQCSVTFFPGVPLTGFIAPGWYTGVQVCGVASLPGFPPSKFILTFNITAGTEELYLEMAWKSTQVLGSGLSVAFEHPQGVNNGKPIFGSAAGKSPLKVYANQTKVTNVTGAQGIDASVEKFQVITRAFSAANTTEFYLPTQMPDVPHFGRPSNKVDFGFAFDQKNEQWVTMFVRSTKPAAFSALPDA